MSVSSFCFSRHAPSFSLKRRRGCYSCCFLWKPTGHFWLAAILYVWFDWPWLRLVYEGSARRFVTVYRVTIGHCRFCLPPRSDCSGIYIKSATCRCGQHNQQRDSEHAYLNRSVKTIVRTGHLRAIRLSRTAPDR